MECSADTVFTLAVEANYVEQNDFPIDDNDHVQDDESDEDDGDAIPVIASPYHGTR
jgi:hypothetical protein